MTRIQHNVIQGSEEWFALKRQYFGASDSAAMMGIDDNTTYQQLLDKYATGYTPEHDEQTLKLFAKGHAAEKSARLIVEELIGEDLYPSVFTKGDLMASVDGITDDDFLVFEHKLYNKELAAALKKGFLPDKYWPQAQQILHVTGAKKLLFVCSDGTTNKAFDLEVLPDLDYQQKIVAGWELFKQRLQNHKPQTKTPELVIEPTMSLPAVSINVDGSLVIKHNLDVFGDKLRGFIGNLDLEPDTDEGFAELEEAVKTLQKAEDALATAKANALGQVASVDALISMANALEQLARQNRLAATKVVKTRKDEIKRQIISSANSDYMEFINTALQGVNIRIDVPMPCFADAGKNKRTLSSFREVIDSAKRDAIIDAKRFIDDVKTKLSWIKENTSEYDFLFSDKHDLVKLPLNDIQTICINRIESHQVRETQRIEAQKEAIRLEEERKANESVRIKEAQRIADIKERITIIDGYALKAIDRPAAFIESLKEHVEGIEFVGFDEFEEEAKQVQQKVIAKLEQLLADSTKKETIKQHASQKSMADFLAARYEADDKRYSKARSLLVEVDKNRELVNAWLEYSDA